MNYGNYASRTQPAPATEKVFGREKEMRKNSGGGVGFKLDPWARLNRFLILGSEGGTFYQSEQKLTKDNAKNVIKLIEEDGPRVIRETVRVSAGKLAYKNEPALFVLALALAYGDEATKNLVADAVPQVARIGTHILTLVSYIEQTGKWTHAAMRAVRAFYLSRDEEGLAWQLMKYQKRADFTHRDALRLSHPRPRSVTQAAQFAYAVDKEKAKNNGKFAFLPDSMLGMIECLGLGKADAKKAIQLIQRYKLSHEMVPTELQSSPEVWEAMLPTLGLIATARSLGRMTAIGLIKPFSAASRLVAGRFRDQELVRKSGIHPIQVLAALLTYSGGHGIRGKLSWTPDPNVTEALDDLYYLSFENFEPTGKRIEYGIDVSGSMTGGDLAGVPGLTPRAAAACIAMASARRETQTLFKGFCDKLVDLKFTKKSSLLEVCNALYYADFGSTNAGLLIEDATQKGYDVDAFVIITDNDINSGRHSHQLLEKYRQKTGINSRMAVLATVATDVTLADPNDPLQADFAGFSTDTPAMLAGFIRGDFDGTEAQATGIVGEPIMDDED